jgi:drug/metabolite transporter (DMT)-like permease
MEVAGSAATLKRHHLFYAVVGAVVGSIGALCATLQERGFIPGSAVIIAIACVLLWIAYIFVRESVGVRGGIGLIEA